LFEYRALHENYAEAVESGFALTHDLDRVQKRGLIAKDMKMKKRLEKVREGDEASITVKPEGSTKLALKRTLRSTLVS
jgi:hypothetical protein